MKGPFHEFVVVNREEHAPNDYLSLAHSPNAVKMPDDLVRYIADSLDWLAAITPAPSRTLRGTGLNYYGPTIIEADEAPHLARLFRAWAAIFKEAPGAFELTGYWSSTANEYERIPFKKDAVVTIFERVAELAESITPNRYLLHFGI